jgi:hypothetical protein
MKWLGWNYSLLGLVLLSMISFDLNTGAGLTLNRIVSLGVTKATMRHVASDG